MGWSSATAATVYRSAVRTHLAGELLSSSSTPGSRVRYSTVATSRHLPDHHRYPVRVPVRVQPRLSPRVGTSSVVLVVCTVRVQSTSILHHKAAHKGKDSWQSYDSGLSGFRSTGSAITVSEWYQHLLGCKPGYRYSYLTVPCTVQYPYSDQSLSSLRPMPPGQVPHDDSPTQEAKTTVLLYCTGPE